MNKWKRGMSPYASDAKAAVPDKGQGGNGVQTFGDKEGMERDQKGPGPDIKPAVIETEK